VTRWVASMLVVMAFISFMAPWFGLLSEAAAAKSVALAAMVFAYAAWWKGQK
jgi:hypothetical protein